MEKELSAREDHGRLVDTAIIRIKENGVAHCLQASLIPAPVMKWTLACVNEKR